MGGGKGGSKGPQTSKVYNSSIPEFAKPYYENIMARAETESNQPYITYGGPRIAGFTGEQQGAFQGIRDIAEQGAPNVDTAANMAYGAGQSAMQATGFNPLFVGDNFSPDTVSTQSYGNLNRQFRPTMVGTQSWQGTPSALYTGTEGWNQGAAGQYMNPYVSNVLDTMRAQATDRYREQQGARSAAARQAGAFGGSRQAIQDYLSERDLNEQLNRMNAEQLSQAYGQGAQMFTSDQARALQSQMANQQAFAQAQGLGAQMFTSDQARALQAGMANQQAIQAAQAARAQMFTSDQARALQAQMANQQARQQGFATNLQAQMANQKALETAMGLRLQGSQQGLAAAQGLGQLGAMQQGLAYDRLTALEKAGATQQGLQQAALETAYKDFINQRDFGKQNINWLTGIMAGVPVGAQSEVLSYEAAPSAYSQLLGTGMAANELSGLLSGSSRRG